MIWGYKHQLVAFGLLTVSVKWNIATVTSEKLIRLNQLCTKPKQPSGNITAQIRRTIQRPMSEEEWMPIKVPPLVFFLFYGLMTFSESGRNFIQQYILPQYTQKFAR
jgi:hypothetical protein